MSDERGTLHIVFLVNTCYILVIAGANIESESDHVTFQEISMLKELGAGRFGGGMAVMVDFQVWQ